MIDIDAICRKYVGKPQSECELQDMLAVLVLQAAHIIVLEEYVAYQREVIQRADGPCLRYYGKTADECTLDEMRDALDRARTAETPE